jgi:hypothetical protein
MVIRFSCTIHSYRKGRPPMVIFQLDVVHNLSNQLPQKSVDEKLSPFVAKRSPLSFISHKTA